MNKTIPRYRAKMHEKLMFGQMVNVCRDEDVKELEAILKSQQLAIYSLHSIIAEKNGTIDKYKELLRSIKDLIE